MNRKLLIVLTVLALSPFALSACGGDDGSTEAATTESTAEETTAADAGGSGGKGGTIEVVADPSGALAYTSGELATDSGAVEIDFDNPASLGHDVRIEDSSGSDLGGTEVISESSASTEVDLAPGTYTYYCSVGSHRAAGMEGTLEVK